MAAPRPEARAARGPGLPAAVTGRGGLLEAVIEGASAGVAVADARQAEAPLVYVNEAFVALTGHSRESALGQGCLGLSAEPAGSPEGERFRQTVGRRGSGTFELRSRRRDGQLLWTRLTLYPVLDRAGHAEFLVATQVDITAERQALAARDAAERRLVGALSSTSEGVLLVDGDGRVVFANRRFRDFFESDTAVFLEGTDFAAAWTRRLADLGTPKRNARRLALARRDALFAGGRDREERLPDGRIVLVNDRPTADGGAVSIATDVTSLKAAERLTAQRAAAIDATQDGIAVTDEGGRFVYMNPSHLAMFGYAQEAEVLGRPWSILYDDAGARHIAEVAMPELRRTGRWRGEVVGRRRDGEPVPQEVSLSFSRTAGIVCVTRDTSARQQSERERARLREQLQIAQRQEAVGQLAAGFAHDFNNLLSAIAGSAALLRHDGDADAEATAHLARISAACDRAAELVRRMLDLGARTPRTSRIDLREPVREAADLLRAGLPREIALELEMPDLPLMAEADATALLQVILNLAINARDAMEGRPGAIALALADGTAGAVAGTPRVGRLRPGARYATIRVADTGSGMPEDALDRIFRPYYSTKGAAGTGLGLAVVASLVRAAEGALAVGSAPGKGTTFEVFWPLDGLASAPGVVGPDRAADAAALSGATVLVCDDDEAVAQVIAAVLERAGAEAATSVHPADALAAVRADPDGWSLVVTDYDMPEMTGEALARAVHRVAPRLPVLLVSALPIGERARGAFAATLAKPVEPAALLAAAAGAIKGAGGVAGTDDADPDRRRP